VPRPSAPERGVSQESLTPKPPAVRSCSGARSPTAGPGWPSLRRQMRTGGSSPAWSMPTVRSTGARTTRAPWLSEARSTRGAKGGAGVFGELEYRNASGITRRARSAMAGACLHQTGHIRGEDDPMTASGAGSCEASRHWGLECGGLVKPTPAFDVARDHAGIDCLSGQRPPPTLPVPPEGTRLP
jgi:hypothetical protein